MKKDITIVSLSHWDQSPRIRNWAETFYQKKFIVTIVSYSHNTSKELLTTTIPISFGYLKNLPRVLALFIKGAILSLMYLLWLPFITKNTSIILIAV